MELEGCCSLSTHGYGYLRPERHWKVWCSKNYSYKTECNVQTVRHIRICFALEAFFNFHSPVYVSSIPTPSWQSLSTLISQYIYVATRGTCKTVLNSAVCFDAKAQLTADVLRERNRTFAVNSASLAWCCFMLFEATRCSLRCSPPTVLQRRKYTICVCARVCV